MAVAELESESVGSVKVTGYFHTHREEQADRLDDEHEAIILYICNHAMLW